MDLQEKIQLSEKLVDQYINEIGVSAAGVQAAAYGLDVATRLSGEIRQGYDWAKNKIEERKRRRMLAKQEKQKEKKNKTV